MAPAVGLAPIPWRYVDTELRKIWMWDSTHFEVKVTAEANSFYWELSDLVVAHDGEARFLAEGRSNSFATAERELREAIGKSYPAQFGYAPYAGSLATTFTLATGTRVDLGEYNGQRSVVTVRLPSGSTQTVVGYTKVVHYELHMETGSGSLVKIQPAHIARIVREGGGGASDASTSYTGMGRIYRGSPSGDCNGKAGFLPNTIDHVSTEQCPSHESNGVPRYAVTPPRHT